MYVTALTMLGLYTAIYIFSIHVDAMPSASTCDINVPCSCCSDSRICSSHPDHDCGGPCKNGYWGSKCIQRCPAECTSCHQDFGHTRKCFQCVDGKYGNTCSEKCASCLRCNKDTGVCIECVNGLYGQTCENNCSQNCLNSTCSIMSGQCFYCKPGTFGRMCKQDCQGSCKDSLCRRMSGRCNACMDGLYGPFCKMTCSGNCLGQTCSNWFGKCDKCIVGKYGEKCNKACPIACKESKCYQTTGTCSTGCMENYIGDKCEDCKMGKYGVECKKDCPPNCLNGECSRLDGICTQGCENGYSDSRFCCSNNSKCDICSSPSECTVCRNGTFGEKCKKACPRNCDGACDKVTGHCVQCILNMYGPKCEHTCSNTCFTKYNCAPRCKKDDGFCEFGCILGFHGDMCELSCSDNCTNSCHQQSGKCYSCKFNRFGKLCEEECSEFCSNDVDWDVCHQSTGYCMHGCLVGFYGNRCGFSCSPGCENNTCDSDTGHCPMGCADGFTGLRCLRDEKTFPDITTLPVILVLSLGVAVLICIGIIVTAIVCKRRCVRLHESEPVGHEEHIYDDLEVARPTDPSIAYENNGYSSRSNDPDCQDYINSTVRRSNDTLSDMTEPQLYEVVI